MIPHRESAKLIERYFKQYVSHTTCQKTANKINQRSKEIKTRALKVPKNKSFVDERITVLVDGGRARTRIDEKPAKALRAINNFITKDGGKLVKECFSERRKRELITEMNPWRETKTWVITNGRDTVQGTTISEPKEFMNHLRDEIIENSYDLSASKISLNADGATWIGQGFANHFPDVIQVLDEFHFSEHLHETAQLMFKTRKERDDWVSECLDLCFENKSAALILKIQNEQVNDHNQETHESIRQLVGYVTNNKERVRYGYFQKLGLPIGSGEIEGAIKKMNSYRIKGASVRWRAQNLKSILETRSVIFNDQYDEMKVA